MAENKRELISGTFKLDQLVLINYAGQEIDIAPLVSEFTVDESLNSMFAIFDFTIVDAVNLLEKYIITGNEKIDITIIKRDTPGGADVQLDRRLVVTGILEYTRPNSEGQAYKLRAISEEAFASAIKRVSRAVKGTVGSIISELYAEIQFDQYLAQFDAGDFGNYNIILPNYTYKDTFALLLTRAHKTTGDIFYMFETLFNGVVYTSYGEMVGRAPFDKFKQKSQDDSEKSLSPEQFDKNRTRIYNIESKLGFSAFDGAVSGGFTTRTHTLDIAQKKYEYNDYFLLGEQGSLPTLDKEYTLYSGYQVSGTPISEYKDSKEYFHNLNTMAFENSDNLNNQFHNNSAKRNFIMQNQFGISHKLTLSGDTRIRTGICIEIEVPPALPPEVMEGNRTDDLISGKYLVGSIQHKFEVSSGKYLMKVGIKKDSINRSLITNKYNYLGG